MSAHGLPTAPPKATDRRVFYGQTTQAEALPPDLLASVLDDAIRSRLDMDVYREAIEEETEERATLIAWIGGAA